MIDAVYTRIWDTSHLQVSRPIPSLCMTPLTNALLASQHLPHRRLTLQVATACAGIHKPKYHWCTFPITAICKSSVWSSRQIVHQIKVQNIDVPMSPIIAIWGSYQWLDECYIQTCNNKSGNCATVPFRGHCCNSGIATISIGCSTWGK
jgi:hypothetical protein